MTEKKESLNNNDVIENLLFKELNKGNLSYEPRKTFLVKTFKEIHQRRLENAKKTNNKLEIAFYTDYENRYDFLDVIVDRGLTLGSFITEKHPEYKYLFNKEKPKHFSEIPIELWMDYIEYLEIYYGQTNGEGRVNYTEALALEDYETLEYDECDEDDE